MTDLIDSVADLTDLRDKDDLEIALATVMFEQLRAAGLRMWRVIHRDDKIWLRKRIRLPLVNKAFAAHDKTAELPDVLLSEMPSDFRICCETKMQLRRLPDENGICSNLFPVFDGREVVCLLEILRPAPLSTNQERLVFGLLRVYCNHLGILAYGDQDELTGLLNRRTFGESFKRIVAPETVNAAMNKILATERRRPDSEAAQAHLAVIDIDFFKRINDQFGHPYGDEVLVLLARLMGQCFRDSDRMFRFGGEEFLVILPDTDLPEAELALERFRAEVEGFNFSQVGRVTVSIGVTSLLVGDTGPDAFGRADQALYVAKHRGRNQVQCYELLIANGSLTSKATNKQDIEMF